MLEILILLEINSRYSFVNISIIFRLIIALLMNRKINSFSAMQECMHYELILFESIFNRAPPVSHWVRHPERSRRTGGQQKRGLDRVCSEFISDSIPKKNAQ